MIATVEVAGPQHVPDWAVLRAALWRDGSVVDHAADLDTMLADASWR